MVEKTGREIILYNYIWPFPVYIYTQLPDVGVSLNWQTGIKKSVHKTKTKRQKDIRKII